MYKYSMIVLAYSFISALITAQIRFSSVRSPIEGNREKKSTTLTTSQYLSKHGPSIAPTR